MSKVRRTIQTIRESRSAPYIRVRQFSIGVNVPICCRPINARLNAVNELNMADPRETFPVLSDTNELR